MELRPSEPKEPARSNYSAREAAIPARATTREAMALVEGHFADHFGELEEVAWPVTRAGALLALDDFIANGLPSFGDYQDAMKAGEPILFHSLLAPALNLGLLSPREVCRAAETAWRAGSTPLNAVEGVARQSGWEVCGEQESHFGGRGWVMIVAARQECKRYFDGGQFDCRGAAIRMTL